MNRITIEFYRREVYGIEREYLTDSNIAGTISALTGQKTVSREIRANIAALFIHAAKTAIDWREVLPAAIYTYGK